MKNIKEVRKELKLLGYTYKINRNCDSIILKLKVYNSEGLCVNSGILSLEDRIKNKPFLDWRCENIGKIGCEERKIVL